MGEVVVSGVRKRFVDPAGRGFEALKGIDLSIASGESFSLLGPSGCGKSTLLRILAGLEQPDSGTVFLDGRDATDLSPERRPTAMVFQNYALFPHLNVENNVGFGLKIRKLSRDVIARKVDATLELVRLSGLNKRRMSELSGGQQQRVALARVLAIEPKIILMDEPLSNLDAALRRSTRSIIRGIQCDLKLTLVYVTHDQEEALMISDRLALMREGAIVQSGAPRELYERPATADAAAFLGQRNMIPAFLKSSTPDLMVALTAESSGIPIARQALLDTSLEHGNGEIWLALRADEIMTRLMNIKDAASSSAGWPAEVALISFAGLGYEIEARLMETGQAVRVWIGPSEWERAPFNRGDSALLAPRDGRGLVYPRGAP